MKRFNEKLKSGMRSGKNKQKEAEPSAVERDAVSVREDIPQDSYAQRSQTQPGDLMPKRAGGTGMQA